MTTVLIILAYALMVVLICLKVWQRSRHRRGLAQPARMIAPSVPTEKSRGRTPSGPPPEKVNPVLDGTPMSRHEYRDKPYPEGVPHARFEGMTLYPVRWRDAIPPGCNSASEGHCGPIRASYEYGDGCRYLLVPRDKLREHGLSDEQIESLVHRFGAHKERP